MRTWNFSWPEAQVSPEYRARIEAAMGEFLRGVVHEPMICHEGVAEVNIALGMPRGHKVNAVLVCPCGLPRAALEGHSGGGDIWELSRLA